MTFSASGSFCAIISCSRRRGSCRSSSSCSAGAYSDAAHDDRVQRLLGSDLSFSFGGEVGLRCFLTPRTALTGGVEYRHLSNADTADRNVGLNLLGGTLELSWFF